MKKKEPSLSYKSHKKKLQTVKMRQARMGNVHQADDAWRQAGILFEMVSDAIQDQLRLS